MFVALVLTVQDFLRVSIHRSWKCLRIGVMFHCFIVCLCCLRPYVIYFLLLWHAIAYTNKLRLGLGWHCQHH